MCGIFAVLNLDSDRIDLLTLEVMSASVAHRGPDDRGFTFFELAGRQRTMLQARLRYIQNLIIGGVFWKKLLNANTDMCDGPNDRGPGWLEKNQ